MLRSLERSCQDPSRIHGGIMPLERAAITARTFRNRQADASGAMAIVIYRSAPGNEDSDMDPVRLLIEAVAVEIGSFYIVHKWIQLTGGFGAKPKAVPRGVGRVLRRRQ
jgi:hypothetical protein